LLPSGIFAAFGDLLLFRGEDGTHGLELWRSDGTPEGTFMVKDAQPPTWVRRSTPSWSWAAISFFRQRGHSNEPTLWRSDGTAEGTTMGPASQSGDSGRLRLPARPGRDRVAGEHTASTVASDFENGTELWRTDGTPEGTSLVKDKSTPAPRPPSP